MAGSPHYSSNPTPAPAPRPSPPPARRPRKHGCLFFFLLFFGAAAAGFFLLLVLFAAGLGSLTSGTLVTGDVLAMVHIDGVILTSEETVDEIRKHARDGQVRGIILRIDSPGGTVGASQEIYDAVVRASALKPVYASMGNTGASGGYYIAAACDKIYANPGTVTGSIGVIFEMTNFRDLIDKVGVDFNIVKSGPYKDIGSPLRPLEDNERMILQGLINDTHEQFMEAILARRTNQLAAAQQSAMDDFDAFWREMMVDDPYSPPQSPEELLRRIADGRLFSGRQAQRLGLIDVVGSKGDCILGLGEAVGLPDPQVHEVEPFPSLLDLLMGQSAKALAQAGQGVARLSYRVHF